MTNESVEIPRFNGTETLPEPFIPTPEKVSGYVDLRSDEVEAQMKSVEGRQGLYAQLMERQEDIRRDHADFAPEGLQGQLDDTAEALAAHETYLAEMNAPEKKGMFSRAWDSIKSFPRKHPVVTTLLAAAAVAGGIAAGFYMAGEWELLMTSLGLDKIAGLAGAAGELAPVTPEVPPLPGGGIYDVPPPMPTPGDFPHIPG